MESPTGTKPSPTPPNQSLGNLTPFAICSFFGASTLCLISGKETIFFPPIGRGFTPHHLSCMLLGCRWSPGMEQREGHPEKKSLCSCSEGSAH